MRVLWLILATLSLGCKMTSKLEMKVSNEDFPIVVNVKLKGSDGNDPASIVIQRTLASSCYQADNTSLTDCIKDLWDSTKPWLISKSEGKLSSPADDLQIKHTFQQDQTSEIATFTWSAADQIPRDTPDLQPSIPYQVSYTSGSGARTASSGSIPLITSNAASYTIDFRLPQAQGYYVEACGAVNLSQNMQIAPNTSQPGCTLLIKAY